MTTDEFRVRVLILAAYVHDKIDAELGDLFARYANNDPAAGPLLHDRLNVIGRPELADRLRRLEGVE